MRRGTRVRILLLASAALASVATGLAFAQSGFADEPSALESAEGPLTLTIGEGSVPFVEMEMIAGESPAPARLELEVSASGGPLDVAISQRATLGDNDAEERRGSGAELRIGQGLVERRESGAANSAYAFVASDDEALTWRPGAGRRGGAPLALQDQVEIGDVSAGFAVERNGVQASLAYVEREATTQIGVESFSQEESFTGLTVTMRR